MCELKYYRLHLAHEGVFHHFAFQSGRDERTSKFEDDVYLVLNPQLRPLQPDISSEESMKIFEQHREKAKEYLKLENELACTSVRHWQLSEELNHLESKSYQQENEKQQLEDEKESLIELRRALQQKLNRKQIPKSCSTQCIMLSSFDNQHST